jgi:hypothetical protein
LIRSRAGISCRESPAHRAQKFTNTTWPRNSDMRRFLPSMALNTKSGASLPTSVGADALDGAIRDDTVITALRITLPGSNNALRMRCSPHRGILELIVVEPHPKRGNKSFTLVTPLS